MTAPPMPAPAVTKPVADDFLDQLQRAAHDAGVIEENTRREALQRIKATERARAFAYRRLNLVKAVAEAVAGAKDDAEAAARGAAAMLREVNWTGASKTQREVADRFLPVVAALRGAGGEGQAPPAPADELAHFEQWYRENRDGEFLTLMEVEVVELPLVEV